MSAELLIRLPDYFPSLINAMQDGFILRGIDGTVVEVNRSFCELIGYDRSEVIGSRPPQPWWPEELRAELADVFERYISGAIAEDDLIFQRRSGERFPALVTNAPLHDSEGRIIGYIGTVKDMTERVRGEAIVAAQYDVARRLSAAGT
ncbi:MAG: PAS domain-containing protein, partial [Planctomycetaceae bacterium]